MDQSDDPLVSLSDIARAAGLSLGTLGSLRHRGQFPPADETVDLDGRPAWRKSTAEAWARSYGVTHALLWSTGSPLARPPNNSQRSVAQSR